MPILKTGFATPMFKSKTFWGGVTMIIGGIQGMVTGVPDTNANIMLIVSGIMAIFLRQGIQKAEK